MGSFPVHATQEQHGGFAALAMGVNTHQLGPGVLVENHPHGQVQVLAPQFALDKASLFAVPAFPTGADAAHPLPLTLR